MTTTLQDKLQTDETRFVEQSFQSAGFPNVEAYRHNSASIRVRVVDERFRNLSRVARMDMVETILSQLPESVQRDIVFCLPIAEDERHSIEYSLMNREFESPLPSRL